MTLERFAACCVVLVLMVPGLVSAESEAASVRPVVQVHAGR